MTEDFIPREFVSTAEASQLLGIDSSQVRVLIRTQVLPAERIGRQWFIGRTHIASYLEDAHEVGRAFSQRIAWSLLASREGVVVPWTLHRQERSRLHSYDQRPLRMLAQRLSGRARTSRVSVGPRVFERLAEHPTWRMGGLAGNSVFDVGIIYVPSSGYEAALDDTNAIIDREQPNLLIRVVDDRWWPFGDGKRGAPVWNVVAELDRFDAGIREHDATTFPRS